MNFPPEIWERIFSYTDPVTLTNLKIVCKCWNEIIEKILKDSELWYKLCKEKIPHSFWNTICESLSPGKYYTRFHEKEDAKFWISMYKLWTKCRNIIKCEIETNCIEPLLKNHSLEHITCMDASGNLVAIGTSGGYVYFYDIMNMCASTEQVVDHKEFVRNVQLLREDETTVCISCSINGHVSFWDTNSLTLFENAYGKLICTSYSYCYYASCNIINVDGSVLKTRFQFGEENIIALGADYNKALVYTEKGYFIHLTLDTEIEYVHDFIPPPNIKVRCYYIFKPDVLICITENGYLGFLIQRKEWKFHNVFPILHGIPTAILIYAQVLVLGLDSGDVYMYHVEDFEKINFEMDRSKKLTLDTAAVISLKLFVHNEEYLAVAYDKKVYTVKLL